MARELPPLSADRRRALLGSGTSRRNKMALLARYHADGEDVLWAWESEPYESRLMVAIDGADLVRCKSYDEDIRPFLKDK